MKILTRKSLIVGLVATILAAFLLPLSAIEQPDYESVKKEGDFEIRKYPEFQVASTPMKSMEGDNQSFQRLFKYISGENEAGTKIEMTAPVIMNEGETGKMRFVVPKSVASSGTPDANNKNVEIETIAGGQFAVLKFADGRNAESREKALKDLASKVAAENLKPVGEAFFSYYDPPFKPSAFCTFEVWQRLTNTP